MQALYFNHLYDPISMVRDNEVKAAMAEHSVACHTFNSDVLYEPWEVLSPAGQPLTSFSHFWERWVQAHCCLLTHLLEGLIHNGLCEHFWPSHTASSWEACNVTSSPNRSPVC